MINYSPTTWANNTSPYINATNLNKLENAVSELSDDKLDISEIQTLTDSQKIIARKNLGISGNLLKGSVPTVNDLPNDAEVGDCYLVVADQHIYIWNGTEWQDGGVLSRDYDADQISFDPTNTWLTEDDVQAAIDELAEYCKHDTQTVNGNPLSFSTDSAQVARSTTVALSPIQASGTPTPSNPIPIYGYDSVVLQACGVNQWDEEWELGYYDTLGTKVASTTRIRTKNPIPVVAGQTYYFKSSLNFDTLLFLDINGNVLSVKHGPNVAYTAPNDAKYVVFSLGTAYGSTYNHDISINYPATDHDYHAYTPATNISETLPATIYGGTFDVESGVLTVNQAIVDMGDLQWYFESSYSLFWARVVDKANGISNAICSCYALSTLPVSDMPNNTFKGEDASNIVKVKTLDYTDANTFQTAVTGQKIVYELATPYEIQLTPQQVALLQGANVITSNGTSIELEYRNGNIATLADLVGTAKAVNEIVENIQNGLYDNAGFHNSTYRGKKLGASVTAEQYAEISAGTFKDLFIGDYWVINGVTWRIAGFDYYLHTGDTECTTHHVVLVPDTALYNSQLNTSNNTSDGYAGVKSRNVLTSAENTIEAAFGVSHILTHRVYLSTATNNGLISNRAWFDSKCDLMNQEMVFGSNLYSPVSNGNVVPNNGMIEACQLPLFALDFNKVYTRTTYWLRDPVSSSYYVEVFRQTYASFNGASDPGAGIRPVFCIKG